MLQWMHWSTPIYLGCSKQLRTTNQALGDHIAREKSNLQTCGTTDMDAANEKSGTLLVAPMSRRGSRRHRERARAGARLTWDTARESDAFTHEARKGRKAHQWTARGRQRVQSGRQSCCRFHRKLRNGRRRLSANGSGKQCKHARQTHFVSRFIQSSNNNLQLLSETG
jgi:hypothetical protein